MPINTVVFVLLAAGLAGAAPPPARSAYDALVARARAGDRTLDLAQLRDAAAAAGATSDPVARERLMEAVERRDWKAIARAADSVLQRNYVDLDAHYFARHAAKQMGDARQEELHHWLEMGLLKALLATGDGRTEATPMVVVSVDEEYFVLRMVGARLQSQSLGACSGKPCDVMKVKQGANDEEATWYFDVHIPMEQLAQKLGQ